MTSAGRYRGIALAIVAVLLCLAPRLAVGSGSLSGSASPYLQMHADDAIRWRPWNEAALAEARRDRKLIFLSIGYATCHWCHVQTRTTFADRRVIALLNRSFVAILVDREERPDLDRHFIEIMQAMTGRSGWPANFFLTPEAKPLFATGYLAAEPEYGSPGFLEVARGLFAEWSERPDEILREARSFEAEIGASARQTPTTAAAGADPREAAARAWSLRFDAAHGGFGRGPKFPQPNVLSFLLRHGLARRDAALLRDVFRTLDGMAAGGLRDQLGGGFHRYAVDRFWQVPHFEMSLAGNALLARLYLEAYQASGESRYALIARGVLEALLARFHLGDGGFAAALDADSEAEEGRFYTWTEAELRRLLAVPEADRFLQAYVDPAHGLVAGRSVLRLLGDPTALATTEARLAASRAQALVARAERPAPLRDEKLLTDWNGLAVSAFAKAAQVLEDGRYRRVAEAVMARLLDGTAEARDLAHSRLAGKVGAAAFLDDYAFLIEALIDLYETDFKVSRLNRARRLMVVLLDRFQERSGTAFRFTPKGRSGTIPSRIPLAEEGMPSGNAAALSALHRLVLYGAEGRIAEQAEAITKALGGYLGTSAAAAPGLLGALDFRPSEAREIVIVGALDDARTQALLRAVRGRLLYGTVLAVIPPEAPSRNPEWPLLDGRGLLDERPTAYVCRRRLCELPVDRPADLAAQLDQHFPPPPPAR